MWLTQLRDNTLTEGWTGGPERTIREISNWSGKVDSYVMSNTPSYVVSNEGAATYSDLFVSLLNCRLYLFASELILILIELGIVELHSSPMPMSQPIIASARASKS